MYTIHTSSVSNWTRYDFGLGNHYGQQRYWRASTVWNPRGAQKRTIFRCWSLFVHFWLYLLQWRGFNKKVSDIWGDINAVRDDLLHCFFSFLFCCGVSFSIMSFGYRNVINWSNFDIVLLSAIVWCRMWGLSFSFMNYKFRDLKFEIKNLNLQAKTLIKSAES